MAKKVHLIAEKKDIFDSGSTICGVPLKDYMHGLEFEVEVEMFLNNWGETLRCKKCERTLKILNQK